MVISEPGLICLETSDYRLLRGFAALWFGPREASADPAYPGSERPPVRVEPALVALEIAASAIEAEPIVSETSGGDEEQRVTDEAERDETTPLTAQERRARAAALRGLLLGRQRRFTAAQAAFTEASRLDPGLSLESVPTFWEMERGAHEAAVRAYVDAGRSYEASMLASRLRTTYRPRLINPRRGTPSPVS
jgi:hypothetical protein